MKVKIINRSNNADPQYATAGSAGMDLRAFVEEPIVLKPMERKMIPTGLFFEIPAGFEGQVRPRSGLAARHGITCLNSPGTVDSDYRGEIKVILINLGEEDHTICNGDRIAQVVFCEVRQIEWEETPELSGSERGKGGFGHTGTK